ncbi:RNase A-like domain-containing protein [Pantoea sp. BAV 3049]|uniref:RNase A-like domain-containing protein n=1 Tax=Pantoea sp. BAV 3049 TaxID=2654188 RepID=UPI00131E793C|nr:RNase A-like domain-containing protein [Pantoea sp. BAV 3049]
MDDGIKIVMSPVQLAAALSDKTVTEGETLSNRLLGGLGLVMGSLELAGATALCIAPEPTGLTKAGCVVVGAHSLDSINTAANQMIMGRDTRTATYKAATAMAKAFGADNNTAMKIGMTVDVAVPLGFALAIGATRVAAVRAGRIRLREHESATNLKPGGHTISTHIGKSDSELLARFEANKRLQFSTTFSNVRIAEEAVSKALFANRSTIKSVLAGGQHGARLTIRYPVGKVLGYGFKRGSTQRIEMSSVRMVIEFQKYNGKPYYILTAFPDI